METVDRGERTRVMIVDDSEAFRAGLRYLIDSADDLDLVAEASDGDQCLDTARRTQPDVVLMDMQMPGMTGPEATRQLISAIDPSPAVLVLTAHFDSLRVDRALRAGADGYLLKDMPAPALLNAIRAAARGESPLDPRVARELIDRVIAARSPFDVTERERDVICLVARGYANKQIAQHLGISEKTVKNHLTNAFSVIGVSSRAGAASWATRNGLADRRTS